MRVLLTTVNSSLLDGINRHILAIATALNGYNGVEILVCTTHPRGELNAELEKNGVRSVSLDSPHGHSPRVFWRFWHVIREFKPDIVHIHVLPLFALILLSLFPFRMRFIETQHGVPPRFRSLRIKGKLTYFLSCLFRLRGMVKCYISRGVRDFCISDKEARNSQYVIYNPISIPESVDKQKVGLYEISKVPAASHIIGTACRLAKIKNLKAMAEVICRVGAVRPDVHAVIIGDGDAECIDEIKGVFDAHKMSGHLHLTGYLPNAAKLVSDMSCFMMTSYEEGMPTAVLEAMSNGVPIAMFEGGGGLIDLMEMNNDGDTFAVTAKLGDVDGLAKSVVGLLSDSDKMELLSRNARGVAQANFSIGSIREKIVTMYAEVLYGVRR